MEQCIIKVNFVYDDEHALNEVRQILGSMAHYTKEY